MKRLLTLLLAISLCASFICMLSSCETIKDALGDIFTEYTVSEKEFRRNVDGEYFDNVTYTLTYNEKYENGMWATLSEMKIRLANNECVREENDTVVFSTSTESGETKSFIKRDDGEWKAYSDYYAESCLVSRKSVFDDDFRDYLDLSFSQFIYNLDEHCYVCEYDPELLPDAYEITVKVWFENGRLVCMEAIQDSDDSDNIIRFEFYDYGSTNVSDVADEVENFVK